MACKELSQYNFNVESFSSLQSRLHGKSYKRIANNTTIEKIGNDCIAIRHFYTDVVRFFADGRIMLSNGGYKSMTTKERINAVLYGVASVYQKNHTWHVVYNGQTYDFQNGMTINTSDHTVTY